MERRSLRTVLERRARFTSAPLAPDLAVHLTREVLSHLGSLEELLSPSQVFLASTGEVSLLKGSVSDARPLVALVRTLLLGEQGDVAALPDDVREILARLETSDPAQRFASPSMCDLALAQSQGPASAGRGQVAALFRDTAPPEAMVMASPLMPGNESEPLEDSTALELAPRAPRVVQERIEVFREEPRPPSRPGRAVFRLLTFFLALFIIVGVLLVQPQLASQAQALWTELKEKLRALPIITRPQKPRVHTLLLDSSPTGAQVEVDGQPLGRTPLAVENRYGRGKQTVRMKHPGYQPWEGTFDGDEDATVQAILKRR